LKAGHFLDIFERNKHSRSLQLVAKREGSGRLAVLLRGEVEIGSRCGGLGAPRLHHYLLEAVRLGMKYCRGDGVAWLRTANYGLI
jgi:hypothetical protein